jgi:uncharacterized protein (DUF2062 family)
MFTFFRLRIVEPITALLLQGISTKQIALSLAIGLVVGVFPVLGTTTLLCTLIAVWLRLNLVAVHAVHYAATPLQLLLIIPFVRVGERLTGAPQQPLSIKEGLALVDQGVLTAITALWDAIVHAVIGWLALGPLSIALVYLVTVWLLQRMHARTSKRKSLALQSAASNR